MVLIGITGPTGAGKTTLLRGGGGPGGAVIDCDAVYHELWSMIPSCSVSWSGASGPPERGERRNRPQAAGYHRIRRPGEAGPAQRRGPDGHRGPDPGAGGGLPAAGEPWPPSTPSPWWRAGWTACAPPPWRSPPHRRCGCAGSWPGEGSRRITPGPGCGPRSRRHISAVTAAMFW